MSGPQILYGLREGELVHVDDTDCGKNCNCVCSKCKRPLVSRQGEILAHCFAHEASDVNCNPSPESLVHSYAKQQIGKMGKMQLSGFTMEGHHQLPDGTARSLHWQYLPTYDLVIKDADVECHDYEDVVPDVVIHDTDGWRLAVEVFCRKALDARRIASFFFATVHPIYVEDEKRHAKRNN